MTPGTPRITARRLENEKDNVLGYVVATRVDIQTDA